MMSHPDHRAECDVNQKEEEEQFTSGVRGGRCLFPYFFMVLCQDWSLGLLFKTPLNARASPLRFLFN